MAYAAWRGPNGSAGGPTSGDFATGTSWSTGSVPDDRTDIAFGAGAYAVDLGGVVGVRSATIGSGVTIRAASGVQVGLAASSVNMGTVELTGALLSASGGLLNLGVIAGEAGDDRTPLLAGAIINDGIISTREGASQPSIASIATLTNDVDGRVTTSGGGALYLLGPTTNRGVIEAVSGGVIDTSEFGLNGTITNLANTVLTGGTWVASGAGSTLWLVNATITTLDAGTVVILDGANANLRIDDGGSGGMLTIEDTLDSIYAGATLEVLGGRDYRSTERLEVAGTLRLDGGTFDQGGLRIDAGGTLSGSGTIASQAIVDGTVRADRVTGDRTATLEFSDFTDFNGRIAGSGTLELSGGLDTVSTSHVTVKTLLLSGADVQLDRNLRYAGHLVMTAGTLDATDRVLTLAGTTTIGTATIEADPKGRIVLTGTLDARGGDALIGADAIRLDGQAKVDHGSLTLDGTITGDGSITVGAQGRLIVGEDGRLTAGPVVTLDGAKATLVFDDLDSGGARVAGFDGRDSIVFPSFDPTGARLNYRADADRTGGTLIVTNGSQTATVHLEENHVRADFALKTVDTGGIAVTAAAKTAFAAVDDGAFGSDAAAPAAHAFVAAHDLHAFAALV